MRNISLRLIFGSFGALLLPVLTGAEHREPIDTKFLRDYAATRGFNLGRPTRAQPTPDGKAVLFLRSGPRSPRMDLYEFDVATKKSRVVLIADTLLRGGEEKLSPEEKARRERMRLTARGLSHFELSPDGSFLLVNLSGKLFLVERKKVGAFRLLPTGKGTLIDPKLSPDGKKVAYVLDHDVYVMDLETQKERPLTTGGTADVSHGIAEFVAQEEMSRFSGYWWSADSKSIAYQESDARQVELWRAADPANPGDEAHPQRYPRPGKKNVQVRLGIVKVDGGPTGWIDWDGKKYEYLATVKWQKGAPLTILVQNRRQQEELLLSVDEKTGKTTKLLVEKDNAWINLDQQMPRWLADGSGFLWTSERSGGPELELRDVNGKLVRVLVSTAAGYVDLVSVDEKTRMVYYRASTNPTETHLCGIPLDGGLKVKRSDEPGQHAATFSENHAIFVKRSTGPQTMPRSTVHSADGKLIAELESVAEQPPYVPNTEWTKVPVLIRNVRGTTNPRAEVQGVTENQHLDFYASVTRPRGFDAQKRYPVIVDVYGGPGHQHVVASMGSRFQAQWLADQGFIVVAIDNRGTPRRGRDWERAIYGNFGDIPIDDQAMALRRLAEKYPELDMERVGITGWSFGGYMSALGVLRRGDVFKAAVAGAPVADWQDYDTHYTERYLALPGQNPSGYLDSSLLTHARNLDRLKRVWRPLLLIHGTRDDNVFFVHTLKLSNALLRAGKDHEVLPLVGFTHMVPDPQVTVRMQERIVRFFKKHLGEPSEIQATDK